MQYHRRGGPSRSCSGWERVFRPRHGHQSGKGGCTGSCSVFGNGLPFGLGKAACSGRAVLARVCVVLRTSPEPAVPCGSARIGGSRGQASRRISTGRLNALPRLHLPPIDPVVFRAPSGSLRSGRTRLRGGLALRCLQRLSFRDIATRRCRWRDNRNTRGRSLPVLSY